MGTLIKKKGSFPLMAKKTVNRFFDDFITKDFDWSDKKFSTSGSNQPSLNMQEPDKDIKVELAAIEMKKENLKVEIDKDLLVNPSENEVRKKENFIKKEFNYRSFCRLPTL
jgi:HSP20 family protein